MTQKTKIEKIEAPLVNREIVRLFLEKLEMLTPEERATILKTIQLINMPIFKSDLL